MKHLLWLVKQMVFLFFKGDFDGSKEAYCLMKLHLSYKSKKIKKGEGK